MAVKGKVKRRVSRRLSKAKDKTYEGKVPVGASPEEYQEFRQANRRAKILAKANKKTGGFEKRLAKALKKLKEASTYNVTTAEGGNPPAPPFATAEDLMGLNEAETQRADQTRELQYALDSLAADVAYGQQEIETGRVAERSEADYGLAARGLGMSSIRDQELFDIDATAALRKSMLQSQLDTARLDTEAGVQGANNAFQQYMLSFEQKKAENAAAIDTGYHTEPGKHAFKAPKRNKPGQGGQGGRGGGRGRGGRGQGRGRGKDTYGPQQGQGNYPALQGGLV